MLTRCLLLIAICRPVLGQEWRAHVERNLDALVSSCVVVPCAFYYPGENLPSSRLKGIWSHLDSSNKLIYHEDRTRVLDGYKGRTRLLGELGKNNCSLEITKVKGHDNGPFCFRIELVRRDDHRATKDMFTFIKNCVSLKMILEAPSPTLSHHKTAYQGKSFTITCTVPHTCPSHPPKIKWSLETPGITVHHRDIRFGNWEVQSTLTIVPDEADDHREITCTAEFSGGKSSNKTMTVYVKRAVTYNHIIIPIAVLISTAVVFSVLCVFMARKYKKQISELRNQDGVIWSRLSRMSRRPRNRESEGKDIN